MSFDNILDHENIILAAVQSADVAAGSVTPGATPQPSQNDLQQKLEALEENLRKLANDIDHTDAAWQKEFPIYAENYYLTNTVNGQDYVKLKAIFELPEQELIAYARNHDFHIDEARETLEKYENELKTIQNMIPGDENQAQNYPLNTSTITALIMDEANSLINNARQYQKDPSSQPDFDPESLTGRLALLRADIKDLALEASLIQTDLSKINTELEDGFFEKIVEPLKNYRDSSLSFQKAADSGHLLYLKSYDINFIALGRDFNDNFITTLKDWIQENQAALSAKQEADKERQR